MAGWAELNWRGFPWGFSSSCLMDLKTFHVKEAPPTVYYVPNFVTEEEAAYLWKQVYAAPKPKWTQLSNRRLQNWGGVPHTKGMVVEPLPMWLSDYCDRITSLGVFGDKIPNHVLVNEYIPGQGIMPHEDGPLYYPTVTTISLGSHTLLDFYKPIGDTNDQETDVSYDTRYMCSLLLEPCSLLVLQNDMYTRYLHGIAQRTQDTTLDLQKVINQSNLQCLHQQESGSSETTLNRSTRISLTIRHVPKTFKIKLKLK